MNPYRESDESQFTSPSHVSYSDVAVKLLQDNFLLTALELHTELVESGREVPQLREFFSNPGNFEQHVSRPVDLGPIHRTPSQATLDSLDMTRYSEDGLGDRSGGDIAVLEFELRKARETINALRANLTQAADCDGNKAKNSIGQAMYVNNLKPHERRALNFLINEYLLLQNYKLTSITFSDENPEQDFEDWDEVGLNVARPSDLVSLYRGESSTLPAPKAEVSTQTELAFWDNSAVQTDIVDDNTMCVSCQTSFERDSVDWNHEILVHAEEIVMLKQQILSLETEKINYHKLYDAAIASLNMLSSPASEAASTDTVLYNGQRKVKCIPTLDVEQKHNDAVQHVPINDMQPLPHTAAHNHYGSGTSTNSMSPDQFEIIDSEKNDNRTGSRGSWDESGVAGSLRRGSSATIDELSVHDTGDWTRVQFHEGERGISQLWLNSKIPSELKSALLSISCPVPGPDTGLGGDLLEELKDKSITSDTLISLVAETLPRLIPHMLVGRRVEAAPLIAACAAFSSALPRARLLQLLLTMLKKPDAADISTIAQAARVAVVCGAGGETLSAAAELLAARGTERRVLAATVVLAAAPHLTVDLSTSLLWSLVLVMCECACAGVRVCGVRAAAMVSVAMAAQHQHNRLPALQTLLFTLVGDADEDIALEAKYTFAPLLARTALILGKLHSDYCPYIIDNISKATSNNNVKDFNTYMDLLTVSVPALVLYVLNVDVVHKYLPVRLEDDSAVKQGVGSDCNFEDPLSADKYVTKGARCSSTDLAVVNQKGHTENDSGVRIEGADADLRPELESDNCCDIADKREAESLFGDIRMFVEEKNMDPRLLLEAMEALLKNQPDVVWSEKDWLLDTLFRNIFKTIKENITSTKNDVINSIINFFHTTCRAFGAPFTATYLQPLFMEQISVLEKRMEKLESLDVLDAVFATVYLAAVLPAVESPEIGVRNFFHKWLVCSAACARSASGLAASLCWYSAQPQPRPHCAALLDMCLVCMRQSIAESGGSRMGECVRQQAAFVLHQLVTLALLPTPAPCHLTEATLASHIVPTVVSLASDDVPAVSDNAIEALGSITQLALSQKYQSVLACCWAALDSLAVDLAPARQTAAARLAAALACIGQEGARVQVLSCLCKLCLSVPPPLAPPLLGPLVVALQAALPRGGASQQLVSGTLLPAIRKLEQSRSAASPEHRLAIDALAHSVAALQCPSPTAPCPAPDTLARAPASAHGLMPTTEAVGRRVSQIFQQSKPGINLQNIFKKKT